MKRAAATEDRDDRRAVARRPSSDRRIGSRSSTASRAHPGDLRARLLGIVLTVFYHVLTQCLVEGIKCHVCKFSGTPDDWGINCNDPFNINGTLRECTMELFDESGSIPPPNTTAFFCRKTVQRVEGKLLVKRSCGWEEYYIKGRECYHAGTLKFNTMSCVCYTDGCNSAPPSSSRFLRLFPPPAAAAPAAGSQDDESRISDFCFFVFSSLLPSWLFLSASSVVSAVAGRASCFGGL